MIFQKIENIKHHFQPQHYETKHQLQGEKKRTKSTNMWRVNNML